MSSAATGTRPHWSVGRALAVQAARRPGEGRLWPRLIAALLSGLLATATFPPYDVWPLAVPAVALLVLACRSQRPRRAALLGLVHGLALFVPMLSWLHIVGVDAWLLVALLESAFVAGLGIVLALVTRLPGWPVWAAAGWVAEELARASVPFGGFPWGRLAFGQTGSPLAPYAALGGAPLVSFVTALTGTLLALAVTARARGLAVVVAAGVGVVAVPLAGLAVPLPTGGKAVTAAVIQGSVPGTGLHFLGRREEVLHRHVAATERLAAAVRLGTVARPDFVVWPENASDIDPFRNPDAYAAISHAVAVIGVPVLVGALLDGPDADHISNTGIVWTPQGGPGQRYVKRHPVPFGEYIPFRKQLSGLTSRLDQIPKDFYAGTEPGNLDLGNVPVGDVICFEVAYDGLVRDVVDGGATVLVVQTNNATYNGTAQPAQQMAMSRLRAMEFGRSVLVASTSGISAIVRPDGHVVAQTPERVARTLVAEVPLRQGRTLAARIGPWLEWGLSGLALAAALLGVVSARRRDPA
ncbi:MAG: apolipoprotein N-acyltransferase [Actinomycetota bacterium]|nr:apolipoprotein N-acyltransferase [Actinomycetota bacterium]